MTVPLEVSSIKVSYYISYRPKEAKVFIERWYHLYGEPEFAVPYGSVARSFLPTAKGAMYDEIFL
jgi:hypothetical protein